jgi:hypothetical protein
VPASWGGEPLREVEQGGVAAMRPLVSGGIETYPLAAYEVAGTFHRSDDAGNPIVALDTDFDTQTAAIETALAEGKISEAEATKHLADIKQRREFAASKEADIAD